MTTQKVNCYIAVSNLKDCKGDVHLPPNETYELLINYPLTTSLKYPIETGKEGMGLAPLFREIGKAYQKAYDDSDEYGIWGHDMGDLILASISVDHNKKIITLGVDSTPEQVDLFLKALPGLVEKARNLNQR